MTNVLRRNLALSNHANLHQSHSPYFFSWPVNLLKIMLLFSSFLWIDGIEALRTGPASYWLFELGDFSEWDPKLSPYRLQLVWRNQKRRSELNPILNPSRATIVSFRKSRLFQKSLNEPPPITKEQRRTKRIEMAFQVVSLPLGRKNKILRTQ